MKARKQLLWIMLYCFVPTLVLGQNNKIDSLKNEISGLSGIKLVENYILLSHEFLYKDPEKTIFYAKKAQDISQKEGFLEQEVKSSIYMGDGLLLNGQLEEGIKTIDEALEKGKNLHNPALLCQGINAKAIYFMNIGNYEVSLENFEKSLEIAMDNKLEKLTAQVSVNLATILTNKGEYIKGLGYFKSGLEYFIQTDDKEIIASIYNNIAVNYHSWNNLELALENYQLAGDIYRSLDNPNESATLNNIGEIYKDQKDYSKALVYYRKALTLAEQGANQIRIAIPMLGLAEVYLNEKDIKNSETSVNKSLSIFQEYKIKEGIARSKAILGGINLLKGDFRNANLQLNEALLLAKEIGIIELESDIYKQLSELKEKEADFEKALFYANQHFALEDSMLDAFKSKQLNEIFAEIEVNQKETKIELLEKDNAIKDLQIKRKNLHAKFLVSGLFSLIALILVVLFFNKQKVKAYKIVSGKNQQISEQHDQLLIANETKDKFLSIIGHDLLSPIGAIRDVIIQLADYPEMFTEEERMSIITDMRLEADSTYFLLTNLLSWAKSQNDNTEGNFNKHDLKKLVLRNINLYKRSAELKSIKISIDIPEGKQILCDHNMLGLVIRNIVSNAIKFTPEGGKIEIYATSNNGYIEFFVSDTGIGISEENKKKLFSNEHITTYGTNKEKGTGLGLVLCKEFVEKHGGTIFLKNTSDKGSTFCFKVPGSFS